MPFGDILSSDNGRADTVLAIEKDNSSETVQPVASNKKESKTPVKHVDGDSTIKKGLVQSDDQNDTSTSKLKTGTSVVT